MKYIMFQLRDRKIPVIFPDELVHKEVAHKLRMMRDFENATPVSAGFCAIECNGTYGESETMKLKAVNNDADVISCYDYLHGIE